MVTQPPSVLPHLEADAAMKHNEVALTCAQQGQDEHAKDCGLHAAVQILALAQTLYGQRTRTGSTLIHISLKAVLEEATSS